MHCNSVTTQIESVPRTLWTEEIHEAIEGHLVDCERCRLTMLEAESFESELRNLPSLDPPPEMASRILNLTEGIALQRELEGRTVPAAEDQRATLMPVVKGLTVSSVVAVAAGYSLFQTLSGDPESGIMSFLSAIGLWSPGSDLTLPILILVVIGLYGVGAQLLSTFRESGEIAR